MASQSGAMANVSILILAKNEVSNIGACLGAVYSQKLPGTVEVIVVDSGSTDGTLEIARQFAPRIEQIPAEAFHHARTRNYAASLAQGEILVYLAADATPASDNWLEALIGNFEDPSVGAVYGKHLPKPGSSCERQDALGAVYDDKRVVKDESSREKLGYRYYHMSTVNAAIRRNVWQSTLFPEELRVFEDLGIAKRILESGWKIVYEPRAAVYHSHNHSTLDLFKRYFDIGFTFKHLGIWNSVTRSSMLDDVLRLLRKKFTRFNAETGRGERTVGHSIRQDVAKSLGLFLGLNERYLPVVLKRRLSAFRVFG
jgi:rhamnosyltransferase